MMTRFTASKTASIKSYVSHIIWINFTFAISSCDITEAFRITESDKMDRETAVSLTTAYARSVNTSFAEMTLHSDGGFMGSLGSAIIEYQPAEKRLVVWGVISIFGYPFEARPAYLEEVKRIAKDRPEITQGASIDLRLFPEFIYGVSEDSEPWLTLRKDYRDAILPSDFIEEVNELTDLAYSAWRHPQIEATENVNKRLGYPSLEDMDFPGRDKL